jgi:hypothetical protein
MSQISVDITGASRSANLSWNGASKTLTAMGGGSYSASFQCTPSPPDYIYSIVVYGDPKDPWTAKVSDGTTTYNHSGHMSPSGYDTTGDTQFTAK